jgi:hypothetical protein
MVPEVIYAGSLIPEVTEIAEEKIAISKVSCSDESSPSLGISTSHAYHHVMA